MRKQWPKVKLGEVLRRSEETIDLQPDAAYRQITVKLWGRGVVLRGISTGAEIAASRQIVARRGQFILSRIDARNGALGIVPPELDEAIVSNDFPVFNVIENRLLPTYLGWICRTAPFVKECKRASEGTTNRVRLQEDSFWLVRFRCRHWRSSGRWWLGLRNWPLISMRPAPSATKPPKKVKS
jgi:type I restriction enzyme S subunit